MDKDRHDERGETRKGSDEERMQGGGYGGLQGAGGAGRDIGDGSGELQGGSYGRGWGSDASLRSNRTNAEDPDAADRERLARPPMEVDEEGRETTIEDEGRSADRGDVERTLED